MVDWQSASVGEIDVKRQKRASLVHQNQLLDSHDFKPTIVDEVVKHRVGGETELRAYFGPTTIFKNLCRAPDAFSLAAEIAAEPDFSGRFSSSLDLYASNARI
jgi:hypothetical protein